MPEQSKRKQEDLDSEGFKTSSICNLIRQTTGQGVGEFITDMVQKENLTLEDVEALTENIPSLPKSEWQKVALLFDLNR